VRARELAFCNIRREALGSVFLASQRSRVETGGVFTHKDFFERKVEVSDADAAPQLTAPIWQGAWF
jgi:hypothetical protein